MATFIEYEDHSKRKFGAFFPDIVPVGYLDMNPEESLRQLILTYPVVKYLGIHIPYESPSIEGLIIKEIADGIGINGTIDMLLENNPFRMFKHEGLTEEQKKEILQRMKDSITPINRFQEPLHSEELEKYVAIFTSLGCEVSAGELKDLSKHEDYGKPIVMSEILSPSQLMPLS